MLLNSSSREPFLTCPCDRHKTYAPWTWTRHTAHCTIYQSMLENQQTEIMLRAAENAEAARTAKIAAEEATRAREAHRARDRLDREHEAQENVGANKSDVSQEETGSYGYNLRPACIRRPPRLFPGMVPSLRPPRWLRAPIDVQPEGPGDLEQHDDPPLPTIDPTAHDTGTSPPANVTYRTVPNTFGLLREYKCTSHSPLPVIPEQNQNLGASLSFNIPPELSAIAQESHTECVRQIIAPLPNLSVFLLALWFYTHDNASSQVSGDDLISSVICDKNFDAKEVQGTTIRSINLALDSIDANLPNTSTQPGDSWRSTDLTIYLPTGKSSHVDRASLYASGSAESFGEPFRVSGFRYHSLIQVLRARVSDPNRSKHFHYQPYKQFIAKPDGTEERVVDDLYTSDAWLEEHKRIQKLEIHKEDPQLCNLERAAVAYMFGSDATTVTNFGQNSVWPIYGYFGNEPKWFRRKPGARTCEHLAYIPKLPANVKDRIALLHGKAARAPLLAHCKRELFHACWKQLLDPEFIHAYHNGIVMKCGDGVVRRLFPRIFTYSADYPEKALIATIRVLGARPCPRCLVQLSNVSLLGTESDFRTRETRRTDNLFNANLTQRLIYCNGCAVNSATVENILRPSSTVPTLNAFSVRLQSDSNFSVHKLLVPDLMHEFELGVWKSVFTHLIRILESLGPDTVSEFNLRFRLLGTFGIDTIRKFHNDVSEMKSLAARDFEDILQCSIPCFSGLFPHHGGEIQVLLFVLAEWHFLAKLQMHTETSISTLCAVTKVLGTRLWHFQDVVSKSYVTHETDKEHRARSRRKLASKTTGLARGPQLAISGAQIEASAQTTLPITAVLVPALATGHGKMPVSTVTPSSAKRLKEFSLQTYKIHALGDFPAAIKQFGTSDSYSTSIVELEHRRVKRQYKRTNQIGAVQQMTLLERREAHLCAQASTLSSLENDSKGGRQRRKLTVTDAYYLELENQIQWGSPSDKYHIAMRGEPIQLGAFLKSHENDPAIKDFYTELEQHIALRLGIEPESRDDMHHVDPSSSLSALPNPQVAFPTFKIYKHAALQANFTTYDVHRAHDTIGPETSHRFVMLWNMENNIRHPFSYAKVLGIYHICARPAGAGYRQPTQRFDFLWVCWLRGSKWGSWTQRRLDLLNYVDNNGNGNGSFDFVDPTLVIRGTYLAPAFNLGRTKAFLRQSIAWDSPEGDWSAYYVIRFVDRDMGMRYLGGGVGHFDPVPPPDDAESTNEIQIDDEALVGIENNSTQVELDKPDESKGGDNSDGDSGGDSDGDSGGDSDGSETDGADVLAEEGAFDI